MRVFAAALVTIALCAASFAGDLGWISAADGKVWDQVASIALALFILLMVVETMRGGES